MIYNGCSWLFRLIFRNWKNQPLEGRLTPEIRLREIKFLLRKKYFRLHELKKREGESFKQIVSWPNSSSTFLNSCWSVGWFFYLCKFRLKSQEWLLIINRLNLADYLNDRFYTHTKFLNTEISKKILEKLDNQGTDVVSSPTETQTI